MSNQLIELLLLGGVLLSLGVAGWYAIMWLVDAMEEWL